METGLPVWGPQCVEGGGVFSGWKWKKGSNREEVVRVPAVQRTYGGKIVIRNGFFNTIALMEVAYPVTFHVALATLLRGFGEDKIKGRGERDTPYPA
ncbi:hypothetical protein [Aeromonas finlandensis]|uniref:hypothetical protein n=1 Tax=Aeromonas finlandensis TaxID=1543375 RepID=UPI0012E009AE|nr:hypothetical protein [Aeromonas finlandensis]